MFIDPGGPISASTVNVDVSALVYVAGEGATLLDTGTLELGSAGSYGGNLVWLMRDVLSDVLNNFLTQRRYRTCTGPGCAWDREV